jgi:integrase/recombinase XerD
VPSQAVAQATAQATAGPIQHLLAAFLLGYEGHARTAYARDLSAWLAFCSRHGIEPLAARRAHIDAYARELTEAKGRARSTVARRLSALAGFYRYATDEGLIERSPLCRRAPAQGGRRQPDHRA